MNSILLSIKPRHTVNILNGDKTIEIRTTCPKEWKDYLSGKTNVKPEPIDVYIYVTKNTKEELVKGYACYDKEEIKYIAQGGKLKAEDFLNGKVVAKFTLNKITRFEREYPSRYIDDYYDDNGKPLDKKFYKNACLSEEELFDYIGSGEGYAWHIDNLVIFDKPKELSEFRKPYTLSCDELNKIGLPITLGIYNMVIKRGKYFITKAPQSYCYIEVEK